MIAKFGYIGSYFYAIKRGRLTHSKGIKLLFLLCEVANTIISFFLRLYFLELLLALSSLLSFLCDANVALVKCEGSW